MNKKDEKEKDNEVRRLLNPNLDVMSAFKQTGQYKKGYVDVSFKSMVGREKQNNGIPCYMKNSVHRNALNEVNDKSLELSYFQSQPDYKTSMSSIAKPTQSEMSIAKNKQILKNRLNQLQQYFPQEFGSQKKKAAM